MAVVSVYYSGGPVEGLLCADPGARTPIGASGNYMNAVCKTFLQIEEYRKTVFTK